MTSMNPLDYKAAGVNTEAAGRLVSSRRSLAATTTRSGVLSEIGGFGGLFGVRELGYRDPVLGAGADGVGTKLRFAFLTDRHDTVGIDLVAMCANDVLVQGAEPLFFLDYLAAGKLRLEVSGAILRGIAEGCRRAGCALLGGETAEMPGFYKDGEYDLAGFAVGVVERERIVDGRAIRPGDQVLALPSTGFHSNGYSLLRKLLFEQMGLTVSHRFPGVDESVGEVLLMPTRIYVPTVFPLLRQFVVRGMAHITGGGITENLPRILPAGCRARIRKGSWPVPPPFTTIQEAGPIAEAEMYRVFNMGVGFLLVVPPDQIEPLTTHLRRTGETVYQVGEIDAGEPGVEYV
ncbi:MAG: phosphoribosylformylglycinamidine cyclo-ligase [Nitrospirae bacterium]|nr:phosphoribosylformylglycinamidine cyclo-ligase [Nitrospirota bacterium]